MIFGDEPRFTKKLVPHPVDGSIAGVTKAATEDHVGPGSYLAQQFEEKRSGWRKPSFSNRQPMQEPKSSTISRSDYYASAVLSPNGTMAMPMSPARSRSPGPGYYEAPPSIFSFPTDPQRRQDLNLTSMSGANVQSISTRPTTMPSTPRFAFSNSVVIKGGVLFQSATNDSATVGPGYYSVPRNDFIKRSYNARVRGSENRVRSASNTPVTTPISSPSGIKPTTQARQLSTPRGSYRPGSAGSAGPSPVPASAGSVFAFSPTRLSSGASSGANRSTTPSGTPRRTGSSGALTPTNGAVQNGNGNGHVTPQAAASASRARSSSAGPTSRVSSASANGVANGSTTRSPAAASGRGGAGTGSSAVLAGRGRGLFSEHGSLEKPQTQQQWQQGQGQGQAIAGGGKPAVNGVGGANGANGVNGKAVPI